MKRIAVTLALLVVATGVFWLFPLFHIVRLDELESAREQTAFRAAEFAQTFWDERLMPWVGESSDASKLFFVNYRKDPQAAREKYGRKVGVSRAHLFVLRGSGTILTVDKKGVVVRLEDEVGDTEVLLHTGLLFGNTVRDATGLLDASDFPNSQHFNEISTELNRLVEARVIPKLKEQAAPGRKLQFVGCAQVSDDSAGAQPLTIIPLAVKVD